MSIISQLLSSKKNGSYKPTFYHNPIGSTVRNGQTQQTTNNLSRTRMNIDEIDINTIHQAGGTLVAGYGNKRY